MTIHHTHARINKNGEAPRALLCHRYAELLWWPQRTIQRLDDFVPCERLNGMSEHFELTIAVHIFKGNQWKVSVAKPSFTFNQKQKRCANTINVCSVAAL